MLIVENLHPCSTPHGLLELFAAFGKDLWSRLILDMNGVMPSAFGHVEMAAEADAANAVDGLMAPWCWNSSFAWRLPQMIRRHIGS